jgi:hypothetical protein
VVGIGESKRRYSLPPCGGGLGRGVALACQNEVQGIYRTGLCDPPSRPSRRKREAFVGTTRGEGEGMRLFNSAGTNRCR